MQPGRRYVVDPEDPRAPSAEVWATLTPDERAAVVAALPPELPLNEAAPPEGDAHFNAKVTAKNTLSGYFRRTKRDVYVASELAVYYPEERVFAPDLIAVLDVESTHERERWVVAAEGRGLDLVLEVHVSGSRRKDLVANAERYARLGIREYFIFDRGRLRLHGHRLRADTGRYEPIVPQGGRYESEVLGLDVSIEGTRLRFYHASAPLLADDELSQKLEGLVDQIEARAAAAEERLEEEQRRREEEQRRREEAEAKLAEALAELERLKRER
ncbi:Uma2 family endonuclease [Myxococcota bacterium]|nr:Uma2 family endonuclease [Myxococcota bacterium]